MPEPKWDDDWAEIDEHEKSNRLRYQMNRLISHLDSEKKLSRAWMFVAANLLGGIITAIIIKHL